MQHASPDYIIRVGDNDWQAAPPVDRTGTPAHAKLRAYWQAQAPAERNRGDIVANLRRAYAERNERTAAQAAERKAQVTEAHAIYEAGASIDSVAELYELTTPQLKQLFWRYGFTVYRRKEAAEVE